MTIKNLLKLKFTTSPTEYSNYIKQQGPFSWWETGGYWLVTDYNIAKDILSTEHLFSCDRTPFFMRRMREIDPLVIKHFFNAVNKIMVMSDNPDHYPRRRICAHGIAYYMQNNLSSKIEYYLDSYLKNITSNITANNSFDFVKTIAEPLPADIMADLFAIPESEKTKFYKASHDMTIFFGGASKYTNTEGSTVDKQALYIKELLTDLIKFKRKKLALSNNSNFSGLTDFMSIMLARQPEYSLEQDEVISQMIMLLVAGQVTLTDQMCNNFYSIFNQESLIYDLKNNSSLIESAIIEANRLDPAVTFTFRVASKDFSYQSYDIKKGDAIFISNHAVNRDPNVYSNPDLININNTNNSIAKNCSFGYGKHFCLGSKVAMLQMCATLKKLLEQFKFITVDNLNSIRSHESLAFSGFKKLQLEVSI